MGLENIVCTECAIEFEASEWSFTRQCPDCKPAPPSPQFANLADILGNRTPWQLAGDAINVRGAMENARLTSTPPPPPPSFYIAPPEYIYTGSWVEQPVVRDWAVYQQPNTNQENNER